MVLAILFASENAQDTRHCFANFPPRQTVFISLSLGLRLWREFGLIASDIFNLRCYILLNGRIWLG